MYVVRQAVAEDQAVVAKLMQQMHACGLAPAPDRVAAMIARSRESFAGRVSDDADRTFAFVLEDTDTRSVVGVSRLSSLVCSPQTPLPLLELRRREHYSDELQIGSVHATVRVTTETRRSSALEGTILAPPYRGHREQLGSLVGLARLHVVGLHRAWFESRMLARLRPPRRDGEPVDLWWTHMGGRFVNLTLAEVERCRDRAQEFIPALFPSGEIYLSILPPEVRSLVGKIDPASAGAARRLERLGFVSTGCIDPIDAGPVWTADVGAIDVIGTTRSATLGDPARDYSSYGFVSVGGDRAFRLVRTTYSDHGGLISIPGEAAGLLRAHVGDTVGVTPITRGRDREPAAGDHARAS